MAPPRYDVLGIGNAIVDVIARAEDDFLAAHGMNKGTMALIDEARAETIYQAMGAAVESSGGSAANTIVGVASFGAQAAFIGKIKDDELGRAFAHDIRAARVAFDIVPAKTGPSTARCYIMVTPDGERTMNTFLGAAQDLKPSDIDEAKVASAAIVYLEGYLWDPPQAKEAFVKAAAIARVVDVTGAGDLFAAGFMVGLARGKDYRTCARLGALAAAEVIQHMGARPAVSLKALAGENGLPL